MSPVTQNGIVSIRRKMGGSLSRPISFLIYEEHQICTLTYTVIQYVKYEKGTEITDSIIITFFIGLIETKL